MIARYRIVRGVRSLDDLLPEGVRQDTRKHTRHILRPEAEDVRLFLASLDENGFQHFKASYLLTLKRRFAANRRAFDELAELGRHNDVYLGCNCPTQQQPEVQRCHTYLALDFLRQVYPDLQVQQPD